MVVFIDEDKEAVTKGMRLMGQSFTLDEYTFGQLIWREVGTDDKQALAAQGARLLGSAGVERGL